jgi:hypothetical protein
MGSEISKLKKQLDKIEKKLFSLALEINTTKEVSNFYYSKIQRKIYNEYEKARIIFSKWTILNIPTHYNEEIRKQVKRIKSLKFKPAKITNYAQIKKSQMSKRNKIVITEDAINDYLLGLDSGQKKYFKLVRSTQQLNITEKELNKSIAEGYQEKKSLYGARKNLQNVLMKDALDKKYITILDKNGKERNYNVKSYADLVARTKMRAASTNAVIDTAIGFGSDLIQVSSHNTTTPFDSQFEGKVYSLSGKDKEFPAASFLPPFHPNCLHSISVYFKEAHSKKEIKKISDFSKGKTEIHPTRKGHIPVSERA